MLYIVLFLIYVFLIYRVIKDTSLLSYASDNKNLNILSYYYLIYRRRFIFVCNTLVCISFWGAPSGAILSSVFLSLYLVIFLVCVSEGDKIRYNKDGTKISLFLFLKTYRFLEYHIGHEGIYYKGESVYFNPVSFVFLCFVWEFHLRDIKKKLQKEKEVKFYRLIISDLQKEKEKLREAELEQKKEALINLSAN